MEFYGLRQTTQGSLRFYGILQVDDRSESVYGKVGQGVRRHIKSHRSVSAAEKYTEHKIFEKMMEGYESTDVRVDKPYYTIGCTIGCTIGYTSRELLMIQERIRVIICTKIPAWIYLLAFLEKGNKLVNWSFKDKII